MRASRLRLGILREILGDPAFRAVLSLWVMARIRLGRELGFSVTRMERQCETRIPWSLSEDRGTCLVGEVGQALGGSPAPDQLFSAQVISLPWGPSPAALALSGGGSLAKFD